MYSIEEDNLEAGSKNLDPLGSKGDTATSQRWDELEGWTTDEKIMAGLKEPPRRRSAERRRSMLQLPLPGEGHVEFCKSSLKVPVSVVTIRPRASHFFQEIKLVHSHLGEPTAVLDELFEVVDGV